jgi:hypothetical protein
LTAVVPEHDNYDGTHYGPKLETHPLSPDLLAYLQQFFSPAAARQALIDTPRMLPWFSIIRDKDSTASVTVNSKGVPHVSFALGQKDADSALHGMVQLLKLAEAAGAVKVIPLGRTIPDSPPCPLVHHHHPRSGATRLWQRS